MSEQLSQWLYTNAPAAWISAAVAAFSLLFVVITRKKPRRLVMRELGSSSLVNIQRHVRKRILVLFDDAQVANLSQIDIEMFNQGTEAISNPIVRIELPAKTKVINVAIDPPMESADVQIFGSAVVVKLPYINAYKDHGEIRVLSVLADGAAEPIIVRGNGEGWSVRHLPLPSKIAVRRQLRFMTVSMFPIVALMIFYLTFAVSTFGLSENGFNVRALLALLPILVPMGVYTFYIYKLFNRVFRRPRPAVLTGDGKSDG